MKPKNILVADDDKAILEALSMVLEDDGYNVSTTAQGQTLTRLTPEYPDLILLDIWMSGWDGGQLCKSLKSHKSTKKIPIILISANKAIQQVAKESGADDYIEKPFDIHHLLQVVAKHLEETVN